MTQFYKVCTVCALVLFGCCGHNGNKQLMEDIALTD